MPNLGISLPQPFNPQSNPAANWQPNLFGAPGQPQIMSQPFYLPNQYPQVAQANPLQAVAEPPVPSQFVGACLNTATNHWTFYPKNNNNVPQPSAPQPSAPQPSAPQPSAPKPVGESV
ncbi:uncharacterized protein LOC106647179 [Copidosoma floridanum]|uniref:uncharacterized protein LOC106647179 n=1 Tax=Copidosoma floridanum TaxID=29053 RepID=UPI0006C96679|nr:uncharacterized protein LOC106647179 [Copidosoma floridanum]